MVLFSMYVMVINCHDVNPCTFQSIQHNSKPVNSRRFIETTFMFCLNSTRPVLCVLVVCVHGGGSEGWLRFSRK